MIHLLLFLLVFAGFAMLCAARDRHQRDLLGRKLPARTAARLRRGGLFLLVLAYPVAGLALGWGYGAVEWLGQLSAGALLTILLLSHLSARGAHGRDPAARGVVHRTGRVSPGTLRGPHPTLIGRGRQFDDT